MKGKDKKRRTDSLMLNAKAGKRSGCAIIPVVMLSSGSDLFAGIEGVVILCLLEPLKSDIAPFIITRKRSIRVLDFLVQFSPVNHLSYLSASGDCRVRVPTKCLVRLPIPRPAVQSALRSTFRLCCLFHSPYSVLPSSIPESGDCFTLNICSINCDHDVQHDSLLLYL